MYVADETAPIVIDNGSRGIKVGLASEEWPRLIFQPSVARSVYTVDLSSRDGYVEDGGQSERQKPMFKYPIERGLVTNWDDMEKLWHHILYNELRVAPEERPCLLTETPLTPKADREKLTQIMFETFKTPAMYVTLQAVMALFSIGITSGMMVDSGDGVTCAVPIYDGVALHYAITKMDLAGSDITRYASQLLQGRGFTVDQEIVRDIKEKLCYVARRSDQGMDRAFNPSTDEKSYELPDGTSITLGTERFRAIECMFTPNLIGRDGDGVHELVYGSIQKSSVDHRMALYKNIALSGGTTMFPGFACRMEEELISFSPYGWIVRVKAAPERKFSAWIGGSILAAISTFQEIAIYKAEYDEYGPSIVHKKCF